MTMSMRCRRHEKRPAACKGTAKLSRTKRKAIEIDAKHFEEDQTCAYDFSQDGLGGSFPTTPCRPYPTTENSLECGEGPAGRVERVKRGRRCKFVSLFEPEKMCYKKFKTFAERDVPFASSALTVVGLDDPVHDDDCQTENDQIKSSLTSLNSDIAAAFRSYLQGRCLVANLDRGRAPGKSACPSVSL